ncbi:Tethering factor for nuclear proteasome sts1 [Kappamyces sp. JEL0680]|nr:Tethering factor for nuclear proteasome sts1 [Kappamyces sp. JEL0680]
MFEEDASGRDDDLNRTLATPKRIRWNLVKELAQQGTAQEPFSPLLASPPRPTVLLPRPTLALTLGILEGLEKKLLDSIPYSRLGPDRSDYSFNRVRGQMDELRGSLLQYLDFFTLPVSYPSSLYHEYPGESFAYLHATTSLVHRLPIWSNEERTAELKDPLYERLGRHWRITVNEVCRRANQEGKVFGSHVVGEWAHNLSFHNTQVGEKHGFKEALDELTRGLGWVIGLNGDGGLASTMRSNFLPFGMSSGTY